MARRYEPEVKAFLAENVEGRSARELAELVNERFGTDFTPERIKSYKHNNHMKSGTQGGSKPGSSIKWAPEVLEFFREHNEGRTCRELAALINERFGEGTMTEAQVRARRKNQKLPAGIDKKFKPGHVPWSAGRKLGTRGRAGETQFKKGQHPHNWLPVGTRRKDSAGYWKRKTQEPDKWVFEHRELWEKTNGPIPKGFMVTFLDGDKDNLVPENLALITNAEHAVIERWGLKGTTAEISEAGIAVAKLKIAMRKRKKDVNQ